MPRFVPFKEIEPQTETRVSAGALVFVTTKEMTERGRPVDEGISNLAEDIHNTLVFADPVEYRASAKKYRADADSIEGTLPSQATLLRKLADGLDVDANLNEKRLVGRDPTQAKKEIAFSNSFFKFRHNWSEFYFQVRAGTLGDEMSGNGILDTIDSFYAQYLNYVNGYKDLGFTPSAPPPPPSPAGDTFPNVNVKVKSFFDAIPWTGILIVGAVGVGGYIVYRIATSKQDEPAKTEVIVQPAAAEGK